jgi:hypothetical protein
MKIEVEIPEDKITRLVLDRIGELFSEDARYRETAVRTAMHRIVDETAERAVRDAADAIAKDIPEIAKRVVREAVERQMQNATQRGLSALKKLWVGFDPQKLTPEMRVWLQSQLVGAVKKT